MKRSSLPKNAAAQPGEDEIREYAYHLYVQSGFVPDRELDNWLEAEACLSADLPSDQISPRLREPTSEPSIPVSEAPYIDARSVSR